MQVLAYNKSEANLQPVRLLEINDPGLWDNKKPPEINLIAAVLERAVSDVLGVTAPDFENPQQIVREAKQWLFSGVIDLEKPKPFSFSWVCLSLNLDPIHIRKVIRSDITKSRRYKRDANFWRPSSQDRWFNVGRKLR